MITHVYQACKAPVYNRGVPSDSFLDAILDCIRGLADEFFAPNPHFDIYSKVFPELGPWENLLHRRAAMAEVLRVLGMFESSGNWREGVDSSRRTGTTNENAEAGAWQESWNARHLDPSLAEFLKTNAVTDGVQFQQRMKTDHSFAVTFTILLLRIDMKNFHRISNGPIRKGDERKATWPDRPHLWTEEESIYPWLRRAAVSEFMQLLAA